MSKIRILFLLFAIPLMSFTLWHKYYVSVNDIEYVKDKEAVQIISRYFIDDFEKALRERYDSSITLAVDNEKENVDGYIEKYLNQKFRIELNDQSIPYNFLGKEYQDDMIFCYLEIEHVLEIRSIDVSNQVLMDMFPDQHNIIKLKVNSRNKSFLLNKENPKGVLKF